MISTFQNENKQFSIKITGTGSYLPKNNLSNKDLEKKIDTNDEWIVSRTGIKNRRIAAKNETTSDLAYKASKKALKNAKIDPDKIGLIIVATISPDMFFPSTSCFVQKKLNAVNATCFDLGAACSGYLYAMNIANSMLMTSNFNHALVIGAEKLSTLVDWDDRNTCVLFGDGAGALVISKKNSDLYSNSFIASTLGSNGEYTDILKTPYGAIANPITADNVSTNYLKIYMSGQEVFKHAVRVMSSSALKAIEIAGLKKDDIDIVIPHQANIRIIKAIQNKLKIEESKIFTNLENYGNTSAASVAIALDEANEQGLLKEGDKILIMTFGAGFTYGATIIEW